MTVTFIIDPPLFPSVAQGKSFTYYPNPEFFPLNREAPDAPYRFKPGGVIAVEVRSQRSERSLNASESGSAD